MKDLFSKIGKSLLEHWVVTLLGSGGIVTTFFAWICRTFLKDWLLTKHSLELHGLVFILVFLVIAGLPILLFMLVKKKPKRELLTDANDIVGTINDWFNNRHFYCRFKKEKSIFFSKLDDDLGIKKGASRKYLPILAQSNKYGIEIGKKTFKLVSLTAENDFRKISQEYVSFEKDPKGYLFSTYDIDNKLRWPKGTTKNYMMVRDELNGKRVNLKFKYKGNGYILIQEKCNSTPIAE